jgi:transcription elongation factor S-II
MGYWKTFDDIRPGAVEKLSVLEADPVLPIALEVSIYNYSIRRGKERRTPLSWENPEFRKIYFQKLRSMIFNLSNPRNPQLLQGLLNGDYTTKELVEMSPFQMFPALWADALKACEQKHAEDQAPRLSGMFACGRCKGNNTSYHQVQTRSADEPMTTFVCCLDCGKRWKF